MLGKSRTWGLLLGASSAEVFATHGGMLDCACNDGTQTIQTLRAALGQGAVDFGSFSFLGVQLGIGFSVA